jgi:TIR domain-containing protein
MERLVKHLRSKKIRPWIDSEGIKAGTKWRDELLQVLRSCDACVPILSQAYLESEHCRMEVFIARSFGRKIYPVMVEDCFALLREHEETKGLEDLFMVRMDRLRAVGLPINAAEAFDRVSAAIARKPRAMDGRRPVYVSYTTKDAKFATQLADALIARGVPSWIATRDVVVGENWREAQARAMMRACCHVVVLDENIVRQNGLRTEILLSEAQGLPQLTVLPTRLNGQKQKTDAMRRALRTSDLTYQPLGEMQWFSSQKGPRGIARELVAFLQSAQSPVPELRPRGRRRASTA